MAVEVGKIYTSVECGDFLVLCKDNDNINRHPYYKVKFLYTGYERSARYDTILNGNVFDPYFPKICNIGYLGVSDDGSNLDLSLFDRWRNIICRCYDVNNKYYHFYGGKGVTVCERWHCYANFLKDYPLLPGYQDMINNPNIRYHIDKDILQCGIPDYQKVYSPTTCMLVPAFMNSVQNAKDHFEEHSNKYFNVIKKNNKYNVEIQINNERHRIGRYQDPIVAANAANHARELFGLEVLNTGIPYIPKEEVNAQNLRSVKKVMVRDIKK